MTQFKFEGDIEILAESQIKLVESVLQKQGFKDGKVIVEPLGQKGDNFMAHVKRFIYEDNDGSTFKMVGKIAPTVEELRALMNIMILFNNEIIMYNEVLPKLNDLQNAPGITEDEKARFPICYGVVTEAPFEFILLEDLNDAGFVMFDKFQPLTNDSVRLVIKDLATYHSLSYAFKNAEPETFKYIISKLVNMWTLLSLPQHTHFFEMVENNTMKLMESDKQKNVIAGSLSQLAPTATTFLNYEKESKYCIIQQGDCWNNNILFRVVDGKPIQDIMIDYQLSSVSNPAVDLLYMIFNCTDHAMRLKHYQGWLDYYHETLDNSLRNHGLEVDRVYPKDQLDADLRKYGKLMVGVSVMTSFMTVRQSEELVDMREMTKEEEMLSDETMAKMSTSGLDKSTLVRLKERVEGIVDSSLEFELV